MSVLQVPLGERSYPIVIAHRQLDRLPAWLRRVGLGRDLVVVTNAMVQRRGGRAVVAALRRGGFRPTVLLVPDTERAKSLPELTRLLNRLAACDGVGRSLGLLAVGGGVIGDLVGLAAALYRRGIPYVQVPTTLLAQVDSAIGGKTAVDLAAGKNLVGAFYQPRLVFSDTAWLQRLPLRQLASGMAEVIKCGVIQDAVLFRRLTRQRAAILARRPAALAAVIVRAARLKARVVARDERETRGERTILNFGHTIGHAIEAAIRYGGRYTHGEAIAVGMGAATTIARRLGLCAPAVEASLRDTVQAYGLPWEACGVRPAAVWAALAHDKKSAAGRLRWVLPTRIGHVVVTPDVPASLTRAVITERIHP